MKTWRILAALLALTLLLSLAATAEEDFSFDFDDEGYTGEWLDVPDLNIELCLPDGWTQVEAGEGLAFAAIKDDGAATLAIRVEAEDISDIIAWADEHLPGYQVDVAGFYDTVLTEAADAVTVYRLNDDDQLMAFEFRRASLDAITAAFALEIVDSVNESWIDEGEGFDDGTDLLAEIEALEGFGD